MPAAAESEAAQSSQQAGPKAARPLRKALQTVVGTLKDAGMKTFGEDKDAFECFAPSWKRKTARQSLCAERCLRQLWSNPDAKAGTG